MSDDKENEEVVEILEGDVVDAVDMAGKEQPAEEAEAIELTIEEQLVAAEAQAAEYLDGWKRAMAETDNIRKRFSKLETDMYINARVNIATELLPLLDDFALAMDSVPATIADDDWYKGLTLLPRKLRTIIEKIGLEEVPAVGEPFDPSFHQAIMREESEEHESGTIIKQYQAGYRLGERLIRPAVVVVAA